MMLYCLTIFYNQLWKFYHIYIVVSIIKVEKILFFMIENERFIELLAVIGSPSMPLRR